MISEYKMFRGHFIGRIVNLRSILEIYDITYDITFVEDTQACVAFLHVQKCYTEGKWTTWLEFSSFYTLAFFWKSSNSIYNIFTISMYKYWKVKPSPYDSNQL